MKYMYIHVPYLCNQKVNTAVLKLLLFKYVACYQWRISIYKMYLKNNSVLIFSVFVVLCVIYSIIYIKGASIRQIYNFEYETSGELEEETNSDLYPLTNGKFNIFA